MKTYEFLMFRLHFLIFALKTYEFLVFRWHLLFFYMFSRGLNVFHVFHVSRKSSGWAGLGTSTENMKKHFKTNICFHIKKTWNVIETQGMLMFFNGAAWKHMNSLCFVVISLFLIWKHMNSLCFVDISCFSFCVP